MKKTLLFISIASALSISFAGERNNQHKGKEHNAKENCDPKVKTDPPSPPQATKTPVSNSPAARSNNEGSHDPCNSWFKPTYCKVLP